MGGVGSVGGVGKIYGSPVAVMVDGWGWGGGEIV